MDKCQASPNLSIVTSIKRDNLIKKMTINKKQKLLLLGFGDIAKRLSNILADNYCITGVRRSADSYEGVNIVQADCRDDSALLNITRENFDVIVITMTPDDMSDSGYKQTYVKTVQTLLNALEKNKVSPQLIIFVSSTSVYGQKNNEWVDECSDTLPKSYSGKRLLEAEKLLTDGDFAGAIVRFSGIYGVGRERLIEQVKAGNGAEKEPILYSNRIHSDDCAGILAHIIQRQKKVQHIESLYLATDCKPSPLYDVKCWLAAQLGLNPDHLKVKSSASIIRASKRCSNQRLLDSGYQFLYPTFKEGYEMVLKNLT
jgi:nucleoside-diphosphate-sugar epimerase